MVQLWTRKVDELPGIRDKMIADIGGADYFSGIHEKLDLVNGSRLKQPVFIWQAYGPREKIMGQIRGAGLYWTAVRCPV